MHTGHVDCCKSRCADLKPCRLGWHCLSIPILACDWGRRAKRARLRLLFAVTSAYPRSPGCTLRSCSAAAHSEEAKVKSAEIDRPAQIERTFASTQRVSISNSVAYQQFRQQFISAGSKSSLHQSPRRPRHTLLVAVGLYNPSSVLIAMS